MESLPCCLFLSSLLREVHSHVRCRNPGKETWKNQRVPHRMSRRFWSMHGVHWMSCRDFSAFGCLQELRSRFPDVFGSLRLNSECDFAVEYVHGRPKKESGPFISNGKYQTCIPRSSLAASQNRIYKEMSTGQNEWIQTKAIRQEMLLKSEASRPPKEA